MAKRLVPFVVQARDMRVGDGISVIGLEPPAAPRFSHKVVNMHVAMISFVGPSYNSTALQVYLDRVLKEDDIEGVFINEYGEEEWVGSGGYGDFELEPHDMVSVWRVV